MFGIQLVEISPLILSVRSQFTVFVFFSVQFLTGNNKFSLPNCFFFVHKTSDQHSQFKKKQLLERTQEHSSLKLSNYKTQSTTLKMNCYN